MFGLIGIIIVAHDKLAGGLLHTVDHVVGQQPGMSAVMVDSDSDRENIRDEIAKAADSVDRGDGVVIVTDIYGGSPFNLCKEANKGKNRQIIYGANVPLLLKLAKSRHLPLGDAVRIAVDAGRKYIGSVPVPGTQDL